MAAATNPTPPGPGTRASLPLAPSLLFYAAMGGAAWIWRWLVDGVGPWAPAREGAEMGALQAGLVGLVAGLGLVGMSRAWTARTASGASLAEAMAGIVAGISLPAVALLALTSGIAEEMLFRGALQPRVGWTLATLLFAAVHYLPRPGLRVWALFALLAGGLFGGLFAWTGSLWAPVVAHVCVNGLNLRWLSKTRPGGAVGRG